MLSARKAHRISLIAGLAVLALTMYSRTMKPVPVCGELATGYAPIIAFEMARSVIDLHSIFGANSGECRTAIAAQMDAINTIDSTIYIPIYGSFLAFFLLGLRTQDRKLAMTAATITIAACAADYIENIGLFKLAANPDVASGWLTLMSVATEVKWVGLGLAGAIGGVILAKRGGVWRLAILPCGLGLAAALVSVPTPSLAGPYLSLAFVCAWILFLLVDAREALRR
jgi:hypothetical protein